MVVVASLRLPAPSCFQEMPPLFVTAASLTVKAASVQVSSAEPASAVGADVIVKAFVSTAFTQLPLPVTVNVRVTVEPPSLASGVYVGVVVVAAVCIYWFGGREGGGGTQASAPPYVRYQPDMAGLASPR